MDDQPEIPKGGSPKAKLAALVLAAVVAVSPLTKMSEGKVNKAYLDPIGKPTICEGHTKGVKLGQVATDEQCQQMLQEDLTEHTTTAVRATPQLAENLNALKAAGDFSLNAGDGAWKGSPMAAHFAKGEWDQGCLSFKGYWAAGTYSKPQPMWECRPKIRNGKQVGYLCNLPGLLTRRIREMNICQTGTWQ